MKDLDCNCNDCVFMIRDMDKFKSSLEFHKKVDFELFELRRNKLVESALDRRRKGDLVAYNQIHTSADKMKFQFNKKDYKINYGKCSKYDKEVRFIPNTLQLETQKCYTGR